MVDELAKLLTPEEYLVVSVVCRLTFGWGKWRDRISVSRFQSITGLSKAAIVAALGELRRFGVLEETAKNERGLGAEWRVELDGGRVMVAALEERRDRRKGAARLRTAGARAAQQNGLSDRTASVCPTERLQPVPQNEARSVAQNGVGLSDCRVSVCATDAQRERQKPSETQEEEASPSRGWGRPEAGAPERGDAATAAALLGPLGVGGDLLAWVQTDVRRCYWACHWAVWFPACRGRVSAPAAFLRARIDGACRGSDRDREAPKEWFDAQACAERVAPLARRGTAPVCGPVVDPEASELWGRFLGSLSASPRGLLGGARRVAFEEGVLVVVLPGTLLQHVRRQELVFRDLAAAAGVEAVVEFRAVL